MVKLFWIICLLTNSINVFSRDLGLETIPAYFALGNQDIEVPSSSLFDLSIEPDSFEWFRQEKQLVLPHVLVKLKLKENLSDKYIIIYKDQSYLPNNQNNTSNSIIQYSLYEPFTIKILKNNKVVEQLKLRVKKNKQIIDYRCDRYKMNLSDISIPLSISCHTYPYGSFNKEKNQVDIYLTSPYIKNKKYLKMTFNRSTKTNILIADKKMTIELKIPERYNRLRTVIGFGPYAFKGQYEKEEETKIAGAVMLYGAYGFTDDVSVKFFDAFVWNKAIFNNGGIYLSNNISKIFDGRLIFNTLLGAQILSFAEDRESNFYTESIFPQGIEATWLNPLGKKNFLISGGIFLNLTQEYDYQNSWIRWGGKGVYYELNYINWEKNDRLAKMWGLSMILPFLSFF